MKFYGKMGFVTRNWDWDRKFTIVEHNKKVLSEILEKVANIAKKVKDTPRYDKVKEVTVHSALKKIIGKMDISSEKKTDIEIQLSVLFKLSAEESGIFAFIHRWGYRQYAFDNIVKLLEMEETK